MQKLLRRLHVALMTRLRSRLVLVRVFERELGRAARIESACRDLECRVMTEAQALAHCADAELELREDLVRTAYGAGGVCLGAFSGARLVGYNWLAYSSTLIASGVCVGFAPQFRYSYKSFVLPAYRGQRIVQALHALADDAELRRGRTRAMNFVESDNYPSIASLERAGSRTAGYAVYLRLFGSIVSLGSPGARRCGVRFFAPPRPRARWTPAAAAR
jgi:ribosomal protein S18 acetylase RimI-like enzyme